MNIVFVGSAQLPRGFRSMGSNANIQYWVGSPARQALIQVKDANGNVVREISGPAEAGMQSVAWDLTRGGAQAGQGGGMRGRVPRVPAGEYSVTVTVGNASADGKLSVVQ